MKMTEPRANDVLRSLNKFIVTVTMTVPMIAQGLHDRAPARMASCAYTHALLHCLGHVHYFFMHTCLVFLFY
jgi:hypothetical protein